jgi:hypothetical protein
VSGGAGADGCSLTAICGEEDTQIDMHCDLPVNGSQQCTCNAAGSSTRFAVENAPPDQECAVALDRCLAN